MDAVLLRRLVAAGDAGEPEPGERLPGEAHAPRQAVTGPADGSGIGEHRTITEVAARNRLSGDGALEHVSGGERRVAPHPAEAPADRQATEQLALRVHARVEAHRVVIEHAGFPPGADARVPPDSHRSPRHRHAAGTGVSGAERARLLERVPHLER